MSDAQPRCALWGKRGPGPAPARGLCCASDDVEALLARYAGQLWSGQSVLVRAVSLDKEALEERAPQGQVFVVRSVLSQGLLTAVAGWLQTLAKEALAWCPCGGGAEPSYGALALAAIPFSWDLMEADCHSSLAEHDPRGAAGAAGGRRRPRDRAAGPV